MRKVIILGQGVIGLTTGLALSQEGYDVEIHSDRDTFLTTSVAACAVWLPIFLGGGEAIGKDSVTQSGINLWAKESYATFDRIASSEIGVKACPLFRLGAAEENAPNLDGTGIGLTHTELSNVPVAMRHVWSFRSFVIDMPLYLSWLVRQAKEAGISFKTGYHYESIQDAICRTEASLIVNCTGLGARAMCEDTLMSGVKGVLLFRPFSEDMSGIISCGNFVLASRSDMMVLGALYKTSYETEDVEDDEISELLAWHHGWPEDVLRLVNVRPEDIRGSDLSGCVAGLRPVRNGGPRQAYEEISGTRVIHSYGHGGGGVTLSWGVATDTVHMINSKLV
jgi:D-amino-acid oxidase